MDVRHLYQPSPEEESNVQARNVRKERRSFSGITDAEGVTWSETNVITPQGTSTTARTYSITDPSGRTADLSEVEGHRCALGGEFLAAVDEEKDICIRCFSYVCALHRIETPYGMYCLNCVYRFWINLLAILIVGGLILCLAL
jgi:hypothetical protein